ncbi:hypothetical protein HK100_003335 [Physocladia obscura]|uniref:Uncharacterized protein n=1 Tax=Physocladia obscura TaxID=109957 RepID=A0AAD5XDA1_9FUNG|nr:hypothetical protein HK100_003335 [Physocladia obscura]
MFRDSFEWIKLAWLAAPFPLMIPAVLAICKVINKNMFNRTGFSEFFWYQCSQILCVLVLASFDALFVTCFSRYLSRTCTTDDACEIDPKFLIISRYGIVANGMCLTMMVLWIASIIQYFVDIGRGNTFLVHFTIIAAIYGVLMVGVYIVLFGMKVALHYQQIEEVRTLTRRLSGQLVGSSGTIANTSNSKSRSKEV